MLSAEPNLDFNAPDLQEGQKDFLKYAKSALPRKIQALLSHKNFQSKLSWIAKQLDASLDEVNDALQLLESLGIISWKNSEIKKNTEYTNLAKKLKGSRTKTSAVNDHRIISHQILNDVDPENSHFTSNGFIATDANTFYEFNKKLLELRDWFVQESESGEKTMLAGYSMTGANVLKTNNGEGQ